MEPVCNKINRGVARERTHGGIKREGRGQKRKRAGAGRGWLCAGVGRRAQAHSNNTGVVAGSGRKGWVKEDKTTPPPATPTLWTRRRTAMECLHPPSPLPPSLPSPLPPLPPAPAPALPPSLFAPSPSPSLRATSYLLRRLLRVYRTALANLELGGGGGVMHPLEWYVLPSSLTWRTSEQRRISGILSQRERRSNDIPVAGSMTNSLRKMIILTSRVISPGQFSLAF